MRVANLLLGLFFGVACPTLGAFLPVSIRNEDSSLRPRNEQQRECLQPASTIALHYMEGVPAPVLLPSYMTPRTLLLPCRYHIHGFLSTLTLRRIPGEYAVRNEGHRNP
jgi:hypothetical protein